MHPTAGRVALLLVLSAAAGIGVWTMLHFTKTGWHNSATSTPTNLRSVDELWAEGVEKVKADRGEAGKNVAFEIPPELRHYDDRRWFLATQVAEVHKQNVQSCQDFLELAALIQRGELVSVPAATEDYILFGVGAKADEGAFTRYQDDQNIPLFDEGQLQNEYARLEALRAQLQNEVAASKQGATGGKKRDRAKQSERQKEIGSREQQLTDVDDEKKLLDLWYGQPENRRKLFDDYQSLQTLARDYGGRTYDLADGNDREAMKIRMLRSVRPVALKVMEEIAADYHHEFDRPLPVSSLIRPEQYQRVLRRVNRAATTIDTPPHSTGLAFDIDYRYMSVGEQMFLMNELARMKQQGRIEVLRERNANYHVFAFIDGVRPSDDLITASLEEVGPPPEEANHATTTPAKTSRKSQKKNNKTTKSKARKHR